MNIGEYIQGVKDSHAELSLPPLDSYTISLVADAWHKATKVATRAERERNQVEIVRLRGALRSLEVDYARHDGVVAYCGVCGLPLAERHMPDCPFAAIRGDKNDI